MHHKSRRNFVFTSTFNSIVSLVVLGDAVTLGMEANDQNLSDRYLWIANCVIGLIMCFEIGLKIRTFGTLFFREKWNVIDVVCIWAIVFDTCECLVFVRRSRSLWLRSFSLVRLSRMFKAILRIFGAQESIHVHFLSNLKVLFPVSVYSLAFLSLLSVIGGVVLVSDSLPQMNFLRSAAGGGWIYCRAYLGDIYVSVLSIFQAMTLDGWFTQLERSLMNGGRWVAAVVVVFIALGGSVIYTSLVVGTFVDQAKSTSKKFLDFSRLERDKRLTDIRTSIHRELCAEFGARDLAVEEIINFTDSREDLSEKFRQLDITADEIGTLWKTLDQNGLERMSVSNLRSGLERVRATGRGRDLLELQSSLSQAIVGTRNVEARISEVNKNLSQIQATCDRINRTLSQADFS